MPNVKISAAADAGTLLSSDMLPLARSGNTNAYHTTMSSVATFTNASLSSGAYGNVGRSYIHNGLFNVQQRGTLGWTTNAAYTADRWLIGFVNGTMSTSIFAASDGDRAAIGDEAAKWVLSTNWTGTSGAGDYTSLVQRIEDVRRLANKTVTLSFWAIASASLKLGANLTQVFGTGGSPSASVGVNGQSVTLSGAWARYSLTFAVPSVAGKTLGTAGNDHTQLAFWYSTGSGGAGASGNVGVQSGTINLWGVQLEIGNVTTPLEKPDLRYDLANCQRFYQIGMLRIWGPAGATAGNVLTANLLPVAMRATPTCTTITGTNTNITSPAISGTSNAVIHMLGVYSGSGGVYVMDNSFTASADL